MAQAGGGLSYAQALERAQRFVAPWAISESRVEEYAGCWVFQYGSADSPDEVLIGTDGPCIVDRASGAVQCVDAQGVTDAGLVIQLAEAPRIWRNGEPTPGADAAARLRRRKPVEQVLAGMLERKEEILWHGRPIPRHAMWSGFPGSNWPARMAYLALALLAMAPFSAAGCYLVWGSVSALLEFRGLGSLVGVLLMLGFGVLLAAGPVYLAVRPRIRAYSNAQDIHYLITSQRALIVLIRAGRIVDQHVKWLPSIRSPWLRMLRASGVGDVVFDAGGAFHPEGASGYTSHFDIGFEGVADARSVLATLEQAIAASRGGRKQA